MPTPLVHPDRPRSAVVTGAARGIGRAVAAELVTRGYRVVVTDLEADDAKVTAGQVGAALGLALDVTDPQATRGVAEEARVLAPLGGWVCNAGVGFDGDLSDLTDDQVRTLVDVNLLGAVWGSRVATDAFRAQDAEGVRGGDLAITASLSAHGPVPGLSLYAATKAAVLSLATSLSAELRPDRIRVHAICPDGVDTRMVADMEQDGRARELIASGMFLQPEDVARALVDMFGTRRVYRTMPAWRGVVSRVSGVAPGPAMRLEPLLRLQGRRRLRKGAR